VADADDPIEVREDVIIIDVSGPVIETTSGVLMEFLKLVNVVDTTSLEPAEYMRVEAARNLAYEVMGSVEYLNEDDMAGLAAWMGLCKVSPSRALELFDPDGLSEPESEEE